jgi:hypothetical protein
MTPLQAAVAVVQKVTSYCDFFKKKAIYPFVVYVKTKKQPVNHTHAHKRETKDVAL